MYFPMEFERPSSIWTRSSLPEFVDSETAWRAPRTRRPIFDEVASTVDAQQGVRLRFRLYHSQAHAHVFVSSGPFDLHQHRDQNVILRFDTAIRSGCARRRESAFPAPTPPPLSNIAGRGLCRPSSPGFGRTQRGGNYGRCIDYEQTQCA